MSLNRDEWLSNQLGRPAYHLKVDDLGEAETALRSMPEGGLFAYAKASTTEAVHFLERSGFYLGDTSVTLEKTPQPGKALRSRHEARFATPEDREGAVNVARRNFIYDRFHNDPHLPKEIADRLKAEWVNNYFNGQRGDAMVVVATEETVIGFNQLLYAKDGALVIDLIAADRDFHRQGVGHDLIQFAENECLGFEKMRVSTQVTNIPSLRLYENMGFRMAAAQYVFHFWRE